MSNSTVPLPPVRKSNLVWLWLGIALAIAVAGGLAWMSAAKASNIETVVAGTGKSAADADAVLIEFEGKIKDGEVFAPKAPFPIPVSFDELSQAKLPGLVDAIKEMNEGGTYKVTIPATETKDMAPPLGGQALEFTVKLVKAMDKAGYEAEKNALIAQQMQAMGGAKGAGATPADKPAATNGGKIKIETIKAGSGAKPTDSSTVKVNYVGKLADGTKFDDGQGIDFPVAAVVPGFGQGLKEMQKGGKYKLTIPPELGYGSRASGPIPANSTLVFEVELLDFTN